ncbi:MAG: hypothetical protein MHPSP_000898 [Paramarteilia canceri]
MLDKDLTFNEICIYINNIVSSIPNIVRNILKIMRNIYKQKAKITTFDTYIHSSGSMVGFVISLITLVKNMLFDLSNFKNKGNRVELLKTSQSIEWLKEFSEQIINEIMIYSQDKEINKSEHLTHLASSSCKIILLYVNNGFLFEVIKTFPPFLSISAYLYHHTIDELYSLCKPDKNQINDDLDKIGDLITRLKNSFLYLLSGCYYNICLQGSEISFSNYVNGVSEATIELIKTIKDGKLEKSENKCIGLWREFLKLLELITRKNTFSELKENIKLSINQNINDVNQRSIDIENSINKCNSTNDEILDLAIELDKNKQRCKIMEKELLKAINNDQNRKLYI